MVDTDLKKTTTTDLNSANLGYETPTASIDQSQDKETEWANDDWPEGLGLYQDNPAYKEPIRALARWTVGKGYTVELPRDKIILESIRGSGEDSFQSIMTNHIITKKGNGDAYSEIVRDEKTGTIINLKPLDPSICKTIFNKKNIIIRYEIRNAAGTYVRFKTEDIFHSMNDRITSEIHGTPAWKACKWELEARKESMKNMRRILNRSTMRVIYVDVDDSTKLNTIKTEWKTGIKDGEVLLLPGQRGKDFEVVDYSIPDISAFMRFLEYLDNRIYQALGVPKPIIDVTGTTEASSKVGFMTFEPVYTEEQTLLEQDIWNQLAIRIKFNRPPSLTSSVQEDETKNTGQTSIQPNETEVSVGRTE